MNRVKAWLLPGLMGLLLASVAYAGLQFREAEDRARRAGQQHSKVLELAQQIQSVSQQRSIAVTHTGEAQSLSGLVETTAADCGIKAKQVVSINAQDARRVGDSPYFRLPTRITLEQVELPKLADLLEKLSRADLLRIEDCRLFAPHGEVVGQTWNAEFTIAYLIYEPTQDPLKY